MALVFEYVLNQQERCVIHEFMSTFSPRQILRETTPALDSQPNQLNSDSLTQSREYTCQDLYDLAILTYFSALFYEQHSDAKVSGWITEYVLIGYKWETCHAQLLATSRYGMPVLPYIVKLGGYWHLLHNHKYYRCHSILDTICAWCGIVVGVFESETEQGLHIGGLIGKCWRECQEDFVEYSAALTSML
jgi:hypothetical protein